jgi:asparagine synthetase B (glutamine-hydrolysing)
MIVAVLGESTQGLRRAIDRLSGVNGAPHDCVIAGGVAVASWGQARFGSLAAGRPYAYVGRLQGELPEPGTELRGDFALVARSTRGLRLARGRFAGRPLYWLRVDSMVVASNQLLPLAIVAHPNLQLEVEHLLGVFDPLFWIFRSPLPFAGARRVRTNHLLDIELSGSVQVHEGPLELEPPIRLPASELAGAVRDEFAAAVARQSEGTRRVAVLTSGGVDSSNLLATAVRNARQRGTAEPVPITLDFGGEGDDRPHLRTLCEHLGVSPIRVTPAEGAPFAGQDRVIDGSIHAVAPHSAIFRLLSEARAAGADLAMLGDGSEFLFAGEPPIFGDFLIREPMNALRCLQDFKSGYFSRVSLWRRFAVGPIARAVLPPALLRLRRRHSEQRAGQRTLLQMGWAGPTLKRFLAERRRYPDGPAIQSQREHILRSPSSDLLMTACEPFSRWEGATGIPICFPYLDDAFVRFVGRLPSAAMFLGGLERGVLRASMEGLVPDSVRYRLDKSRPYQAFGELFAAAGGYESVRDLVTMRELGKLGIVDPSRFRASFERFVADPHADVVSWGTLGGALAAEAHVRWFHDFMGMRERPSFATAAPGPA